MAGFFSPTQTQSGTQNTNQTQQQDPWAQQQPYLLNAFGGAQDAYNKAQSSAPNNFVASQNPQVRAFYQSLLGQAGGAGDLMNAGSSAFTSGINGLSGFNPTSFSQVMSDANTAANDPSVQGRIDASTRDARTAASDALRLNNQTSAMSGNINSSRAGARDAVIGDRLAQTVGGISSNIRGDAFNTGLNASLNRAGSTDTSRLGALGALLNGGSGAMSSSSGLFNMANTGATGLQSGDQSTIDNDIARWSSLFQPANSLYGIVGGSNWGGTTTGNSTQTMNSTRTSNPSGMDILTGLMGAGKSLFF